MGGSQIPSHRSVFPLRAGPHPPYGHPLPSEREILLPRPYLFTLIILPPHTGEGWGGGQPGGETKEGWGEGASACSQKSQTISQKITFFHSLKLQILRSNRGIFLFRSDSPGKATLILNFYSFLTPPP